jgi:single-stranded DNA-binding protein
MLNRCVLIGRLTKKPELRYLPAGTGKESCTSVSIAITPTTVPGMSGNTPAQAV